jgi:hypothetical protein
MDDLAEIHLIGCPRKAGLRIAVKVSSLQAFTCEEIIRRQSFERAESKCKDSEESLGDWIGRQAICQRPRIRRK